MIGIDLEEAPAQYIAQNLVSEIDDESDLTYHEEVIEEGFSTGPNSFEQYSGQTLKATVEGYERKSAVEIQELPFGKVQVSTRVHDSPSERFDKRTVSIEVEEPSEHRLEDSEEAQKAVYEQIKNDLDTGTEAEVIEAELEDSLIIEYSWEW